MTLVQYCKEKVCVSAYQFPVEDVRGIDDILEMQAMNRRLGGYSDLRWAAEMAASEDDLPGFLRAHSNGAFSPDKECPMAVAAKYKALSILGYGLQHKDSFLWDELVLFCAVQSGCIQAVDIVLRAGCQPCSLALSTAVECGHLDCVRFLHARGLPLWDAVHIGHNWWFTKGPSLVLREFSETRLRVPRCECKARALWGVMRYGKIHGAPLPECAGWILKDRQVRAREVLLCFNGAARMGRSGGEHARLWGVMADVPLDVVYNILVQAQLEIEETFKPRVVQITLERSP